MDISIAAVRLAFVALPGLIATQVYRKLRGRRKKEGWETFFEALLFAISSYTLWFLILLCWYHFFPPNASHPVTTSPVDQVADSITNAIFDEKASPAWIKLIPSTITPACLIGAALAFLASAIHKYGWINRFARKIHVSNRAGDEDVWERLFDDKITDEWLFVRDHKLGLIYFGHPAKYSESQLKRELLLTTVSVFSTVDTSKALYETPALYLSRESDELTIEVPLLPPKEVEHVGQIPTIEIASAGGEYGKEGRVETGRDNTKT